MAAPMPSASAAGIAASLTPRIAATSRLSTAPSATPFAALKTLHKFDACASCGALGEIGRGASWLLSGIGSNAHAFKLIYGAGEAKGTGCQLKPRLCSPTGG